MNKNLKQIEERISVLTQLLTECRNEICMLKGAVSEMIGKEIGMEVSIKELKLPQRAYNGLKKRGINTIQELTKLSYDDIMGLPHLGRKSAYDIESALSRYNLSLCEQ